jgi:DNA-binding transcriptional LysR family regulator
MTLRQLEVFLAVAREKSFSLAAKKIHSSQPTLSEHISELESELAKQLFFRRGRRRVVAVTEAGRVFEQFAERAVSAVEGARQALADLDGLAHGSLLIGASTTPGLYVLPRIVAAFRTKYPGIEVKLQIANSQAIEGRVRERELDLGIVGGHALRPGEECLRTGMRDELVLVVFPCARMGPASGYSARFAR